jgi:hypothetical protein
MRGYFIASTEMQKIIEGAWKIGLFDIDIINVIGCHLYLCTLKYFLYSQFIQSVTYANKQIYLSVQSELYV